MRSISLAVIGLSLAVSLAIADTDSACMSRCSSLGSSYAYCQSVCRYSGTPKPYDPTAYSSPAVIGENYVKSLQQARENQLQQNEDARARQLADAQEALIAEQTQAIRLENETHQRESATEAATAAPIPTLTEPPTAAAQAGYQHWIAAAIPRAGRFQDFEAVVFAQDVQITPAMIDWMSRSTYAADVAYYLSNNKSIASLIARQTSEAVAESLARIESEISYYAKR